MNRRNFLKHSSLAGLSLSTLAVVSCNPGPAKEKGQETATAAAANRSAPGAGAGDFALHETTIAQLQQQMESGARTARSITQLYLDRIAAIDQQGPTLKSVIEVNPDALAIADALDQERKNGKVRGPLHGIPVLIKDNIDTADKMMTTAGSLALEGNRAAKDAFIVARLREALGAADRVRLRAEGARLQPLVARLQALRDETPAPQS